MNKLILVFFIFLIFQGCKQKESDEIPLLSVQESIKDIEIEKGFVIEPVCTEPLIEDPVAFDFDENANIWVVEMRGYMHDTEGGGEDQPLGRIKIIYDTNGDGKYDSSNVFLDSLIMPRTVTVVKDGILLIEPPSLFFVENSKGKAGKKILIDSTFAETGNVEHQPNGLLRAIDNWYYCASGNKRVKNFNGSWVVEKTFSRGQWGITMDDEGRLYYNNNSVMLMADNFLPGNFASNKNHRFISGKVTSISLTENKVYPRRPTEGVNRGYQSDVLDKQGKLVNVTSACGPVIYRGDNFPKEYYGNAFVMEPAAFLMKRILISEDKEGLLKGEFAYKEKEFLTATDERFRPVSAYNSPDGCLYFVDMHRGVIQHTTYMTPYLRKYVDSLHLERPIGMGRIYRVRWKNKEASKPLKLSGYSSIQLVDFLKHPNGYYRAMAQRLLSEKKDEATVEPLMKLVVDKTNSEVALQALWILANMNKLNPPLLKIIANAHPENISVYQSCLRLLGENNEKEISFAILQTLRRENSRIADVCFLNSLNAFKNNFKDRVNALSNNIINSYSNDPLITDAFVSISEGNEEKNLSVFQKTNPADTILIKALNTAIKRSKQPDEAASIAHLTNAEKQRFFDGKSLFTRLCSACHGKDGEGMTNVAPPLAGSEWVNGNPETTIRILLDGLSGPLSVNNTDYKFTSAMPGLRNNIETNNGDIAAVLTYIRNSFGNRSSAITVEQVGQLRSKTENRSGSYTLEELKSIQ